MTRRRLDRELVARGLARDVEEARRAVEERRVVLDGASALKASTLVRRASDLHIRTARKFVSRGGEKLEGALDDLGIDPRGRECLDAGAGSGGFTDCLLRRGASSVVAIDVGYGQFDWGLRNDPRVKLHERLNLRTADLEGLGGPFDLVVADLSFISLETVADRLIEAARSDGELLLLVKPQFEAERGRVPRGGVVTDPEVRRRAVEKIARALGSRGWGASGVVASRLRGAEGNTELFLWARRGAGEDVSKMVEEAVG